jgi:prepilin peptidase CpaA
LIALLALAALQDAIMLKISNYICGAVLLLGVARRRSRDRSSACGKMASRSFIALRSAPSCSGAGSLAAGDVKLFAATVLWFDLGASVTILVWTALAGGVLAVAIIVGRTLPWPGAIRSRVRVLQPKPGSLTASRLPPARSSPVFS